MGLHVASALVAGTLRRVKLSLLKRSQFYITDCASSIVAVAILREPTTLSSYYRAHCLLSYLDTVREAREHAAPYLETSQQTLVPALTCTTKDTQQVDPVTSILAT